MVGEALKASGVSRSELFLVSKVSASSQSDHSNFISEGRSQQLQAIRMAS
jgi:diketogulonate reductase-like aldo/keto reductase